MRSDFKKKKRKTKASFTVRQDKIDEIKYSEAVEDMDNQKVKELLIDQGIIKA